MPEVARWSDETARLWARDRDWKFTGYYKYRFSFTAEADGIQGYASAGGDSGDIYRYQVDPVMQWNEITDGCEWDLRITDAHGDELYAGPG